jgi:hypothetical protein
MLPHVGGHDGVRRAQPGDRAEDLLRNAPSRDPGAKGARRPASKEDAKGAARKAPAKKKLTGKHGQRKINAKSKTRRVTKKAALS